MVGLRAAEAGRRPPYPIIRDGVHGVKLPPGPRSAGLPGARVEARRNASRAVAGELNRTCHGRRPRAAARFRALLDRAGTPNRPEIPGRRVRYCLRGPRRRTLSDERIIV